LRYEFLGFGLPLKSRRRAIMKKYPHGLNLRAVCAAIDAFEAQQDDVPEAGMIAAFEILLTASGIVQRAEAAEAKLAELVPDEKPADSSDGNDTEAWFDEGWNACRAVILRNIEEAG